MNFKKWAQMSLIMALGLGILRLEAIGVSISNADESIFSEYNNNSGARIDYSPWTEVLELTVWDTGRSDRHYARRSAARLGSRINHANPNPSSLEANRVFYHVLEQEHLDFLSIYRRELEAIPSQIDLSRLSRNEQLAYWLNLYSVTVFEQVSLRYPIRNLSALRNGEDALWNEKLLMVAGVPLSLRDVETRVLSNWRNPLVLYGLYQGSIGGPNIRRQAFSGQRIWTQLESNAREFINSLRGVRFMGSKAHVSELYAWGAHFFPGGEQDLKRHLLRYAEGEVYSRLSSASSIDREVYDWFIADLYNGEFGGGASSDNPAEFVMNQSQSFAGGSGDMDHSTQPGHGTYRASPVGYGSAAGRAAEGRSNLAIGLPDHVQELINQIRIRMASTRQGTVTVEEVAPGASPQSDGGGEPDPDRGDDVGINLN